MNYTTLEESRELFELGISVETADMNYSNCCFKGLGYSDEYHIGTSSYKEEKERIDELIKIYGGDNYDGIIAWEIIPAWSGSALFELIPEDKEKPFIVMHEDNMYHIECHGFKTAWHLHFTSAVCEIVCLLIKNGLIKVEAPKKTINFDEIHDRMFNENGWMPLHGGLKMDRNGRIAGGLKMK